MAEDIQEPPFIASVDLSGKLLKYVLHFSSDVVQSNKSKKLSFRKPLFNTGNEWNHAC